MKIHEPIKDFIDRLYPKGNITQYFGENVELYAKAVPGLTKGHNGIDIVAPWGTPLLAVEDGIVIDLKDDATGYGKYVRLMCDDTTESREWTYGHLSYILCKVGNKVKAGDCIGLMGNTGFVISDATGNGFWHHNPYAGTHLHLGLRIYNKFGNSYSILNYNNGYLGSVDFKNMLPEPPALPIFSYNFTRPMQLGERSLDIGKLQEYLKQEGYFEGEITNYYGPITRKAVLAFQNDWVALSMYEKIILKGSKVGPKTLLALNLKTNVS
jgi:murein DD-endopeptidase MepM/ murein hydrolase activator NlpD